MTVTNRQLGTILTNTLNQIVSGLPKYYKASGLVLYQASPHHWTSAKMSLEDARARFGRELVIK